MTGTEPVPLNLNEPGTVRRRGCVVVGVTLLVGVILGAAAGGIVGVIWGEVAALSTAAAVVVALFLLSWLSGRRRLWLEGTTLVARTVGRKTIDLTGADRVELIVTDLRGVRTVGMLLGRGGRRINLPVAMYSGTGGRELGILPLRRLADALAANGTPTGLVFSELLVAQLRAEAKGDPAPERPLYRLASLAPTGRVAHRLKTDAVTRFVASLD